MERISTILIHTIFASLLLASFTAEAQDFAGSKDHPLIKRFAGAKIIGYEYSKFDEYKIQTSTYIAENKTKEPLKAVEGAVTRIWYQIPGDNTSAEVFRNYVDALNAAGFKILWDSNSDEWLSASEDRKKLLGEYYSDQHNMPTKFEWDSIWFNRIRNPNAPMKPSDNRKLVAQLSRGGADTYAVLYVTSFNSSTRTTPKGVYVALEVVDTGSVKLQQMVTVSADDMSRAIGNTGRVALYGIYFDTNKSELKPESEPALGEIAKLMKAEGNLRLHVVGHTDNVGSLASNMDLSKRRAQSVVDALAKKYAIAPTRLIANGVASLAPVASNTNEEGRALNRRVELVPQ
jgi:OmpA-OmpF porin, OOP family